MKDIRPYIIGMPTSAECFAWWKTRGRGEGTKHHARQRGAREQHVRGVGYWCNKANMQGRPTGSTRRGMFRVVAKVCQRLLGS